MEKGNTVKTPVTDNVQVGTVVIDDEEADLPLPVNDNNVQPEFVSNLVDESPPMIGKDIPVFDKDVREDLVIDLSSKEKSVETSSPGSREVGDMMHPLFINCLLDKISRMEERVNEVAANRDLMKVDNVELKEKMVLSDKQLLRLRNHKNKLIRRVLKLHNENDKNEEKLRELNAQVALMQFRGQSLSQSSGVNIQVFNAPINL